MEKWRDTKIDFGLEEGNLDLTLYEFMEIRNGFLVFKWANIIPWTSEYPQYYYINKDKVKTLSFNKY